MNVRLAVICLAVAAVVAALVFSGGGGGGGGKKHGSASKPAADAIHVTFAYSPEKEALLKPAIAKFNAERKESGGRPVFVDGENVSSGDAETRIGKARLKLTAWSPASSLWGRLLNFEADRQWVPDDNPSIVRTPLVIAMWEPLARALGYPRKPVGFKQILDLATSKTGWAKYGKPQYGQFKLGHTNPDFSTSGLSAVAGEYYAATGKLEGLTERDIANPQVRRRIKAVERSIVHYGDTTLFFADQMERYGPAYASAAAMEEVTLIDFNRKRRGPKLVAIYPKDGTFYSDSPFIVLDAPWVTAQQKAGAHVFQKWLAGELDPNQVEKAGFRPADPSAKIGAPIDAAHGANPSEPKRVLGLPEPRVLARLKTAWRADRKPANIVLVVDTSGSMSEEGKLEQAQGGLKVFFRQLAPQDRVGLVSFSDRVTPLIAVSPFGAARAELESAVADLFPDGQTAVYDATIGGLHIAQALRDPTRINSVVVLTDGEDNQSDANAGDVVAALERQSRSEGLTVRVYTIAYGSQANQDVLTRIADASGGKEFQGDPKDIEAVYRSISSFF
jgi:Ca-activated chloride channel family protein